MYLEKIDERYREVDLSTTNVAENAKRNIIWGILNKITTLILPFILRTFMIQYLGAEYLGLNGLFTSILQVLSLAELGFGEAMILACMNPLQKIIIMKYVHC